MHFELTRNIHPGKQLTSNQRGSSLFSEEPRVGTKVLRRGTVLKLNPTQFKSLEAKVYRLHEAGAITMTRVEDDGTRHVMDPVIHQAQKLAMRQQLTATTGVIKRAEKADDEKEFEEHLMESVAKTVELKVVDEVKVEDKAEVKTENKTTELVASTQDENKK